MHKRTHAGSTGDRVPDVRERSEQVDVIQQRRAESFCRVGKLRPGVGKNLFEIRQRGFGDANLEIQSGIFAAAASSDTVRPASASPMPRSIAASVSGSTSTDSVSGTCSF